MKRRSMPDAAEIWFSSGEKERISLLTQEAKSLLLENGQGGLGTAFGYQTEILLQKKDS